MLRTGELIRKDDLITTPSHTIIYKNSRGEIVKIIICNNIIRPPILPAVMDDGYYLNKKYEVYSLITAKNKSTLTISELSQKVVTAHVSTINIIK